MLDVDSPSSSPLRILIADSNDQDRQFLSSIIESEGHQVLATDSSDDVLQLFEENRPEIVVLDSALAGLAGQEVAQKIKQIAGPDFVPILFSIEEQTDENLSDCLESGGDDILNKPFHKPILRAKLNTLIRMRDMQNALQIQRDEIAQHNHHLLQEQEVAKAVFDKVLHPGCLNSPNIKYMLSPLAMFNGDVLLAALKPSGGMHVFLGDFTGHGLPAAIGAMPLAEVFYHLTSKGFAIADIVSEINTKLKSILPTGVFCCAYAVDVCFDKRMIKVWSGGIPESYLYCDADKSIKTIASEHLPLGILDSKKLDTHLQVFEIHKNDRLLICSDGISEALDENGKMFGDEGILNAMQQAASPDHMFSEIQDSVRRFMGDTDRDDDVTLVEIKMVGEFEVGNGNPHVNNGLPGGPKDWSLEYTLGPVTLREFNPLPLMLHVVMEVPGLRPYSGQVYIILSELYSNALEHGLLGLESDNKATATGFVDYYEQRDNSLAKLEEGYVKILLKHNPAENGGVLQIRMEDSGKGFDFENSAALKRQQGGYSGRGIPMLESLCDSVDFYNGGSTTEVCYVWRFD